MKQVVTKQGKTFDYSQILLFNVSIDNIVVILNDKEQLDKFSLSGNSKDAPIAVIPYSEEELKEIVSSMKPIAGYRELSSDKIFVEYADDVAQYNTKVIFDSSNKEIIENNLIEQRKAKERNAVGIWYDSEQNKETSTVITEEQRFKVLQVEKYEEQIVDSKNKIKNTVLQGIIAAFVISLPIAHISLNNMELGEFIARGAGILLNLKVTLSCIKTLAKQMAIEIKKEEVVAELENLGINIEELKGKGTK